MRELGVIDPIVTLGALGAVHIDDGVVMHSECPTNNPKVEVGAGDAFVAGYCSAMDALAWRGLSPVALGLATASAHVDGSRDLSSPRISSSDSHAVERVRRLCRCDSSEIAAAADD